MAWCILGQDTSKQPISKVLKTLSQFDAFPYARLDKVINARNGIYHSATLNTFGTSAEIVDIVSHSLGELSLSFLKVRFDRLSLVDMISDEKIRDLLRKAEHDLLDSEYANCVIGCCHAFGLLRNRVKQRAHWQLAHLHSEVVRAGKISGRFVEQKFPTRTPDRSLRAALDHADEQINKKLEELMSQVDLQLTLGSSYEDFKLFEALHPVCYFTMNGKFHYEREAFDVRNYNQGDATFAFDFVLRTIIEIEPRLKSFGVRALDGKIVRTIT